MEDRIRKQTREMLLKIVEKSDVEDIKDLTLGKIENRLTIITNLAEYYIHYVLYSNKD